MTEEEVLLMEKYGVTFQQRTVFCYRGHKYERLKDALDYAKIDAERSDELPDSSVNEKL